MRNYNKLYGKRESSCRQNATTIIIFFRRWSTVTRDALSSFFFVEYCARFSPICILRRFYSKKIHHDQEGNGSMGVMLYMLFTRILPNIDGSEGFWYLKSPDTSGGIVQ